MARIIRRISVGATERDPNFGPLGDGAGGDSNPLGNGSSPRTGEPDPDDIGSASDDIQSGGRVNGDGTDFVDPTTGTRSNSGTGAGTRRRGRPAGSTNRKRATPTQTSSDIAAILYSLHLGMANAFKSELFAITEDEAKSLGAAITRVTELYEIRILPEKQMAWINLVITMGSVYAPRIIASNVRAKAKKRGPQVVEMPNQQPSDAVGTQFVNPAPQGEVMG